MKKDGLSVSPDSLACSESVKESLCVITNDRPDAVAYAVRTTHPKEMFISPKQGKLKAGGMVGMKLTWREIDPQSDKRRYILIIMMTLQEYQEAGDNPWREMKGLVGKFRLPITFTKDSCLSRHLAWARDNLSNRSSTWNITIPYSRIRSIPSQVTTTLNVGFIRNFKVILRSQPEGVVSLFVQLIKKNSLKTAFGISILTPTGKTTSSVSIVLDPLSDSLGSVDFSSLETISQCLYECQSPDGSSEPCFTLKIIIDGYPDDSIKPLC